MTKYLLVNSNGIFNGFARLGTTTKPQWSPITGGQVWLFATRAEAKEVLKHLPPDTRIVSCPGLPSTLT